MTVGLTFENLNQPTLTRKERPTMIRSFTDEEIWLRLSFWDWFMWHIEDMIHVTHRRLAACHICCMSHMLDATHVSCHTCSCVLPHTWSIHAHMKHSCHTLQCVGACIAAPRHVHATQRTSLRCSVAKGPRTPHPTHLGSQTIRHGTCVNELWHIAHKTQMSAKRNIYSPTTLTWNSIWEWGENCVCVRRQIAYVCEGNRIRAGNPMRASRAPQSRMYS